MRSCPVLLLLCLACGSEMLPSESDNQALDKALRSSWDHRHRHEPALFRFKLSGKPVVLRQLGSQFLAQHCPGRAAKRPLGREVDRVATDFDDSKFHFAKANGRELLLAGRGNDWADAVLPDLASNATAILINVSPILRYHFLLVPSLAALLPQVLTDASLVAAGHFLADVGHDVRLLFNSLGGASSVNHLHFQGYYMSVDGFPATLPLESEEVRWHSDDVGELISWPLHTVVVSASNAASMANLVFSVVKRLISFNIAHHLLLMRRDSRYVTYVVARRLQRTFDSRYINVAANEAVGWLICPDEAEFEKMTADKAVEMLARWRLPEETWDRLNVFGSARALHAEL
eukprot:TRINITY_DN73058_c0_g1_i1.p1 TRINITY_DN73058_c0_g1~~TRINITY_DN73058_c0_g1_i1.p1  ORF type:complete len:365 (-),score=45.31 TRINITY_DN73058_c0_g1_i1:65-1102(-)